MRRVLPVWVSALLLATLASCAGPPAPAERLPAPDSTAFASYYATPGAALQAAGATRAFLVRPDGDLTNGAWRVALRATSGTGGAGPPATIAFEERWLPAAHWTRTAGGVRFEFEAVAPAELAAGDTVLFASVRVCARNTAATPATATIEARFDTLERLPPFVAADALPARPLPSWRGTPGAALVAGAFATGSATPRVDWTLAPGEARVAVLTLSTYALPPAAFERGAPRSHEQLAEDTRRHWRAKIAKGARFGLGDPDAEHALAAASVILLSERARRGADWLPVGGPFHYRDVWLRDGARAVAALAVLGHDTEARALARGFARYQWPNGAFVSQRGQLDGTGQALWMMAQTALRPTPDSTLARFAVLANGAVAWLASQREQGSTVREPFAKLLPVTDARDNEFVFGQLVGNDAWAISGLRSAAELLRAAGRAADADRAEQLRAAWQAEFDAALARTGHADVPATWQGTGRDWGNLAVGWPCRALPASHPRLRALAERWWRAGGGPGLGWYGTPALRHGYVGADLGTWAMLADRPADALAVLDAHLAARDGTGGAAETFDRDTRDFGRNLPPHATSAAALAMLVRNAILYDDDDTLRLTMAPRPTWWRGAHVQQAPTRWGALDVAFSSDGTLATWAWTPVTAWTRLSLPAGARLAAAPAPPLVGAAGGRAVYAPPGTTRAEALLAPEGGR